jgi:peptidoglycan/LPS O-acetylase OafA/YrhL
VFFFFPAGMALALLRQGWELRAPALRTRLARTHSDLLVLVSLPLWLLVCWRFSLEPLAAVAGALLVAACVLPLRPGGFARVCETWALSRIGLASYSLYLWHVPVLIALSAGSVTVADAALSPHTGHFVALALGGGGVALALAALSYALVEAPPLRWRRGWASSAASSGSR